MKDKYKKNFLEQVIVRIDFANPIEDVRERLDPNINLNILKNFPLSEPKKIVTGEIKIKIDDKNDTINNIEKQKFQDWNYFGKNREKELHFNMETLNITYRKYQRFSEIKNDFLNICKPMFSHFNSFAIKRLGLRYVNKIILNEPNSTNWEGYFDENLISVFNIPEKKYSISRAFSVLEVNEGDTHLTFHYGMYNSDYPAPIHKKEFILDYDASYSNLIQNFNDLEIHLKKCKSVIDNQFEKSVDLKLKEIMNE